ncbi:hypothetical protein RO3G_16231 [Lichtheimia corymbifera JMRC:FSU:9682]|uniref:C3H1-type domain-containing protein n=1 Tax=Lichtheimia corymbifera JMRC:FSU:9682 TaxID=1263082 RepID=A0A068RMS6_9FUNG|nr:hypothetical protein RO3G_16231 [Lichtheimia corymbifera JMRC:FSU:9682]
MAHQQWQGSRSYYPAWSDQYNNQQQQPYQYSHSQQDQYDPSYPYYYPSQQQHVQEQYPYTPTSSQQPRHASVIHRLHEQTQQQQALGALAAASITSALQGGQHNSTMWYSHQQPAQTYTQQQQQHYPPQRAMVAYNDLEPSPAPSPPRPQGSFCCNRWYRTQAAKEQHERNHIQCTMCTFSGIKAVMDEHMEVEHGQIPPEGSLRKKNKPDGIVPPNAPKITTPEELAAWIEARKRNWPTKANIERKQREQADRAARGQLPKESDKKRKRKDDGNVDSNKVPKMESMNVLGAYGSDDDDDDDSESDSDASVDIERDAVTAKDPTSMGKIALPSEHKPRSGPRCRFFARGNCRHGNKCRYIHEKPTQQQNTKRSQPTPMEEKRPNLLRMLLAKEIKEEQNIILQCFRHIVDNQFFGRS